MPHQCVRCNEFYADGEKGFIDDKIAKHLNTLDEKKEAQPKEGF